VVGWPVATVVGTVGCPAVPVAGVGAAGSCGSIVGSPAPALAVDEAEAVTVGVASAAATSPFSGPVEVQAETSRMPVAIVSLPST
jgi:hypothetical protein